MLDNFKKEKADFLKKRDKSKKGSIDKDAVKIVSEINSKDNYYTTSICSGRIVLLEMKSKRKDKCIWLFVKHDKVKTDEILKCLQQCHKNKKILNGQHLKFFSSEIWFKQQPIILHVACRNIDAAKRLLDTARKLFKHSGIIGITDKKVVVEIIGSERIETILADKNFVADKIFIKNLIKHANKNFAENKRKSEVLLNLLKSELFSL